MEDLVLGIAQSCNRIKKQQFRRPGQDPFTNAVLDPSINITSLIRDLDPSEEAILLSERKEKVQAPRVEGSEENVEVYCAALEQLNDLYPTAGLAEKIAQLRQKSSELTADIEQYEELVERQRQELAKLNIYYGTKDFESPKSREEIERECEQLEADNVRLRQEIEMEKSRLR